MQRPIFIAYCALMGLALGASRLPAAGLEQGLESGVAVAGCCDSLSHCAPCACDCCTHCCPSHCRCGQCLHRTGVFAEYLYLETRGIDLYYGVPQDGIGGIGTVPAGEAGVLNFAYESGYRVGGILALDCCSSITATFTSYEANTFDMIQVDAPNVIEPLVTHPNTFNAGFTAQQAFGAYSLDFQLADVDYKAVWRQSPCYHVNYLVGARYAHLDQAFESVFPFAPPDGTTSVQTDINFDGGGIRFGLEGERYLRYGSGFSVYAKGTASFVAGEFRNTYVQTSQFGGTEAVFISEESRVVPILETELGVGWTSPNGRVHLSAGYLFACWVNVITTPEYISAVQSRSFVDISQDAQDTITFDGLATRLTVLF